MDWWLTNLKILSEDPFPLLVFQSSSLPVFHIAAAHKGWEYYTLPYHLHSIPADVKELDRWTLHPSGYPLDFTDTLMIAGHTYTRSDVNYLLFCHYHYYYYYYYYLCCLRYDKICVFFGQWNVIIICLRVLNSFNLWCKQRLIVFSCRCRAFSLLIF